MKIGIDLRPLLTSPRTGVGEYTFGLLDALFHLDKTNEYFLYYNSAKTDDRLRTTDYGWNGENIHFVHTFWPNKLLNASIGLFGRPNLDTIIENCKLKIENLDTLYSPNFNFTSVSPRTHFVLTVHDLSFELFPEFFSKRQRVWHALVKPKTQCQRADLILTPSENTKRDIVDYYKINPDKIKVIYPGLSPSFVAMKSRRSDVTIGVPNLLRDFGRDPELASGQCNNEIPTLRCYNRSPELASGLWSGSRACLGTMQQSKYILYLGSIESRKNVMGIIRAFEYFATNIQFPISNISLVLAGPPGYGYDQIRAQANKSPLKDKIKFLGFVAETDKPALYAGASLFVYPSFYEGFGFPVLEAMAMGVPVITSNRSSIPEITGAGAYLVNPNFPAEIAVGMEKLLGGNAYSPSCQEGAGGVAGEVAAALRDQQIKNDFTQAAKFSWENSAQNFLQLLSQL